ncbi:MAG: hypothetical protein AAGC73_02255 [Verrucomicrobiota bacterium]
MSEDNRKRRLDTKSVSSSRTPAEQHQASDLPKPPPRPKRPEPKGPAIVEAQSEAELTPRILETPNQASEQLEVTTLIVDSLAAAVAIAFAVLLIQDMLHHF